MIVGFDNGEEMTTVCGSASRDDGFVHHFGCGESLMQMNTMACVTNWARPTASAVRCPTRTEHRYLQSVGQIQRLYFRRCDLFRQFLQQLLQGWHVQKSAAGPRNTVTFKYFGHPAAAWQPSYCT